MQLRLKLKNTKLKFIVEELIVCPKIQLFWTTCKFHKIQVTLHCKIHMRKILFIKLCNWLIHHLQDPKKKYLVELNNLSWKVQVFGGCKNHWFNVLNLGKMNLVMSPCWSNFWIRLLICPLDWILMLLIKIFWRKV